MDSVSEKTTVLSFSISWKLPKGIMGIPSLMTPAILEVLGLIFNQCLVTLESPFNNKFNISASTHKFKLRYIFLMYLKILAAIIFYLYASTPQIEISGSTQNSHSCNGFLYRISHLVHDNIILFKFQS